MVLIAEIETAKKYIAELEADIKQYTMNISLPIKERMYGQWEYLKDIVKKIEDEYLAPNREGETLPPEPVAKPIKAKK